MASAQSHQGENQQPNQSLKSIFNTKYEEFARDLLATCPEYTAAIQAAIALTPEERRAAFRSVILPKCSPGRDGAACPDQVLPGVTMTQEVWLSLSEKSKKAVQEYLTVLSFTLLMDSETTADLSGNMEWNKEWANKMMNDMKSKMEGIDFAGLSEKIAKLFGSAAGADGKGFPQMPEKFLKGQIAKLAEEIVKEFRVEDFGIDPAQLEACGNDPTKALQMMMDVFMRNPGAFQATIQKMTKKLQHKVQTGALRPQELVAEAEELMKTFSENPQFVEMMEAFRQSFGFEDEEQARSVGRDGEGRLAMARARLRRKLEAKKGKK